MRRYLLNPRIQDYVSILLILAGLFMGHMLVSGCGSPDKIPNFENAQPVNESDKDSRTGKLVIPISGDRSVAVKLNRDFDLGGGQTARITWENPDVGATDPVSIQVSDEDAKVLIKKLFSSDEAPSLIEIRGNYRTPGGSLRSTKARIAVTYR